MTTTTTEVPWVDMTIHGTSEELRAVHNRIEELMTAAGWDQDGDDDYHFIAIRLVTEEIIVNAAKHGNGMDATRPIFIRHHITETEVAVSVQDCGQGFNPHEVADPTLTENLDKPSGRGLLLAKEFASEIEYIFISSHENWTNHVRFIRRREHSRSIPIDD